MIRDGDGSWLAAVAAFHDPHGLRLQQPDQVRLTTPEEMAAELAAENEKIVIMTPDEMADIRRKADAVMAARQKESE